MVSEEQRDGGAAKLTWINPYDQVPRVGERVLVYSQQRWEKSPSLKVDTWDAQYEAPVAWSSETVYVGTGWDDHDEFNSVLLWARVEAPTIPADSLRGATEGALSAAQADSGEKK